jgi:hypothetical protein
MTGETEADAENAEAAYGRRYPWWRQIPPRSLVLVDAIGALVTAVVVGLVLPSLEPQLGISSTSLHTLAIIATAYAILSWGAFFVLRRWHTYLRVIGLANLGYVAVTVAVLIAARGSVTGLGAAYFVVEVVIIVALASVELAVARRYTTHRNQSSRN